MQAKPKANSIITTTGSFDDMIEVTVKIPRKLTFTVLDTGEVETDLSKWSAICLGTALVHGVNQRIPDGAAIGQADKDGVPIPAAERSRIKYEKMNELAAHYESGTEEWNRKATGGEGGGKSLTIEAIARWKGVDYDAAEVLVAKHAEIHKITIKAALAAFRKNGSKTKAAMQEIRDERAKANSPTIDPDAMLEEMKEEGAE